MRGKGRNRVGGGVNTTTPHLLPGEEKRFTSWEGRGNRDRWLGRGDEYKSLGMC